MLSELLSRTAGVTWVWPPVVTELAGAEGDKVVLNRVWEAEGRWVSQHVWGGRDAGSGHQGVQSGWGAGGRERALGRVSSG